MLSFLPCTARPLSPARQWNSFPGRELARSAPSPKTSSSSWLKASHIWSDIRSSRFLRHSAKSSASNPPHHLAPAPHQLLGSFCTPSSPRARMLVPLWQDAAVQNHGTEADVAPGTRVGDGKGDASSSGSINLAAKDS